VEVTLKRGSRIQLVATALIVAASSLALMPSPAHADRCQPEELAGLPAIIQERDNPVCFVMDNWGYPFLCPNAPDTNGDGSTNPGECASAIDPDVNNPPDPTQITQFQPNAFRIYCSIYKWIWARAGQNAACQF
jgi:hypothetical protein